MVQHKVQEQIKTLNMKLEELRVEHMTNEASSESIISCLNDKLSEVQRSLNDRVQNFSECDNSPSAPHEIDGDGDGLNDNHLYPSLHNLPTMPRSISLHAVEVEHEAMMAGKAGNSLGSSPQISLASSSSSRSNTPGPKHESDS